MSRTLLFTAVALICVVSDLPGASKAPVKALGVNSAPITVELYTDYQCPACGQLFQGAIKPLIDDYVRTGKVYLIHRDFPLPVHSYARQSARYATAAASIGRFEQVSRALFDKQAKWSASGKLDEAFSSVLSATELAKVRQIAQEPQTDVFVQQDLDKGTNAGVKQTPTMVITHRLQQYPISGIVSYTVLRRFLDSLLSK
jgi:protein-disulfide isomerase